MRLGVTTRISALALPLVLPCQGLTAPSQPNAATNVLPPSVAVPATVTAATGDPGGQFYGRAPDPARTHRYFIAAEPELWDFTPLGEDVICGKPLPPPVVAKRRVTKFRYVQYTDATFKAKVIQPPRLGILGPVLRGAVGDFLAITFLNRTSRPLSMHPHGAKYDKDSEGAFYEPKPGLGAAVGPGAKFTYVWHLDKDSGPRPDEPSSKGWLYHSHVNADEEINLGLIGFLIVTDPNRARPDGTPNDVDREQAALFLIFDESGLGEAEKEAAEYANLPGGGPRPKPWAEVQQLMEAGGRYSINGYIFGNLPGLEMIEGERVRWYLFGLGSEVDFHTAHWHGLRVVEEGRRGTDVIELLPASMKVADMTADNPGSWLFHCHVAEHMMEGMFARMIVHPKGGNGAGRLLDQPFFGLRQEQQSLQIKQAEARLAAPPAREGQVRIAGAVTVFEAFSVFTQPVTVSLLDKSVQFKPDRRGQARVEGGQFQVRNASREGVIYGGLMEFALTLQGPEWNDALKKHGLKTDGADTTKQRLSVPLKLQVGTASHQATAELVCVFER